jgi:hypothetical protein
LKQLLQFSFSSFHASTVCEALRISWSREKDRHLDNAFVKYIRPQIYSILSLCIVRAFG